jgi:hypothetical protein
MCLHHQPQHMRFTHGGASPLFLRIVRQHQNQTLGDLWLGRGGPVNWPARSPDLSPLDIWLWKHLKLWCIQSQSVSYEVLQQGVENACQGIRVKPGVFERLSTSMQRRAESCVEMHGTHIEHLLQRSHEHEQYLSRHWFLDIRWLGRFCLFKWVLYPFKVCNTFFNILYKTLA